MIVDTGEIFSPNFGQLFVFKSLISTVARVRTTDQNSARNSHPYHMIILSASILNFDNAALAQRSMSSRWKLINKRFPAWTQ
jgi:hypothetical protein